VDPLFNNAIDGNVHRIADIPESNETSYGRISSRTGAQINGKGRLIKA
jgi:hypothetical protein